MRRAAPRPIAPALERLAAGARPMTLLARVQSCWEGVAGSRLAREAEPVAERDGVVTIACRSAVWAQELELLSGDLETRLNAALGAEPPAGPVTRLRFVTQSPGVR